MGVKDQGLEDYFDSLEPESAFLSWTRSHCQYAGAEYSLVSTILVKNVGAHDTDCAKFDSYINNKHSNPPFPRSMLYVVFYTSKVLHNIDKGDRRCLDMKFCIKWASMYMVIRKEVKVMLFRLSAPRIFDQDCMFVFCNT